MKKRLIAAAFVFIGILAAVTAVVGGFNAGAPETDCGEFIVSVNEIERLITNGDTQAALECAANLKGELSSFSPETSGGGLWIVFAASAAIISAAFGYVWFAVLRPFKKLEKYAESIAAGKFDAALEYERANYFGKFTWAFDSMRREIVSARACEKEAIENNKTVIATLSHDIKTPVASIRAYAEGLEAGLDGTPEKRRRYLNVIMNKCDEVSRLTDDMFLHSLSDLDKLKMNKETLEFCEFAENVITEIGEEYGDVRFSKPMFSANVCADRNRLTQIFGNVITNARKYAKTDIDVAITRDAESVSIHFRDYGGGIPDADMPFIFGKFYRGKNCGGEQGSGLGLFIVRYVAEQHGGSAALKNCAVGLEVTISLPWCG